MKSDEKFMNYTFVEKFIPLGDDYIAFKNMCSVHDDCDHEAIFKQVSVENDAGRSKSIQLISRF